MIDLQLCEYNYDLMENQYRSTDCNKLLIRLLLIRHTLFIWQNDWLALLVSVKIELHDRYIDLIDF